MSRIRILAVRHGESEFNQLRDTHPSKEERFAPFMYLPDCNLTEKGREQSREAGRALERELFDNKDDDNGNPPTETLIWVVSPLRRALQTAQHMMEGSPRLCSLTTSQTIRVHPAATEVMVDACDIGTPTSQLQQEFASTTETGTSLPKWDFSLLTKENWWPLGHSPKETWELMVSTANADNDKEHEGLETPQMCQVRFQELQRYLVQLAVANIAQTTTIVLVCHSETIWYLTRREIDGEGFGTWTKNGEILDVTEHILV